MWIYFLRTRRAVMAAQMLVGSCDTNVGSSFRLIVRALKYYISNFLTRLNQQVQICPYIKILHVGKLPVTWGFNIGMSGLKVLNIYETHFRMITVHILFNKNQQTA